MKIIDLVRQETELNKNKKDTNVLLEIYSKINESVNYGINKASCFIYNEYVAKAQKYFIEEGFEVSVKIVEDNSKSLLTISW